jgi:unsaturated rhamnogalacturonyl hydrolase
MNLTLGFERKNIKEKAMDQTVEKVKTAMLSMQRASWEQGVAAQALLELGERELVILMAKESVLRQDKLGRLSVLYTDQGVTDAAAAGEALFAAAGWTGDQRLKDAHEKMLDYLINHAPKTADGTLSHVIQAKQLWIDSIYMAPPFLAVAGHPSLAVEQIEGMHRRLWDPQKELYSHMWDEDKGEFIRKDAWGVGNGWAAAGLARVIAALPTHMQQERDRLIGIVSSLIKSILRFQRQDGLFHDVVDDVQTFVETNLAQMLAYAIYRGVAAGWLDRQYLSAADGLRQAARQKVDEWGLVQDVCGAPFFNAAGTATEGQAFFLLMEAAHRDMLAD